MTAYLPFAVPQGFLVVLNRAGRRCNLFVYLDLLTHPRPFSPQSSTWLYRTETEGKSLLVRPKKARNDPAWSLSVPMGALFPVTKSPPPTYASVPSEACSLGRSFLPGPARGSAGRGEEELNCFLDADCFFPITANPSPRHPPAAAERSDRVTIDAKELRSALGLIAENPCGENVHGPIIRAPGGVTPSMSTIDGFPGMSSFGCNNRESLG